MPEYYVIGPTGEKYGPANVETLNAWASENRITNSTLVEDAATGIRTPVTQIVGVVIQPSIDPMVSNNNRPYEPINNHLAKAIISTFCGCHLLGIIAIVFAAQVDGHARRGDMVAARESARKANILANISIGCLIAYLLFYVGLLIIGVVSGGSSTSGIR